MNFQIHYLKRFVNNLCLGLEKFEFTLHFRIQMGILILRENLPSNLQMRESAQQWIQEFFSPLLSLIWQAFDIRRVLVFNRHFESMDQFPVDKWSGLASNLQKHLKTHSFHCKQTLTELKLIPL